MALKEELIGFIGVGMIGTPMVKNLQDAGVPLLLHDVDESRLQAFVSQGARKADSPKAVADEARIVFVSLPMPPVVKEVALGEHGLIHGAKMKTYVDLSTTGALMAAEVAAALEPVGIACVDCPVSGGLKGANEGTLSLMLSGPEDAIESIQPLLDVIGRPFYLGPDRGLGQTMKCCNNYVSAAMNMALAEAMVTGVKAGLDPNVMLEVMNASTSRSSATESKYPDLVNKGVFKNMATRLLHKDVSLFVQQGEQYGLPLWMGNTVKQYLAYGLANGKADQPSSLMIEFLEEWAGVSVRKKQP